MLVNKGIGSSITHSGTGLPDRYYVYQTTGGLDCELLDTINLEVTNHQPTIDAISDQSCDEDAAEKTVSLTGGV